jgi:hypothetical protein
MCSMCVYFRTVRLIFNCELRESVCSQLSGGPFFRVRPAAYILSELAYPNSITNRWINQIRPTELVCLNTQFTRPLSSSSLSFSAVAPSPVPRCWWFWTLDSCLRKGTAALLHLLCHLQASPRVSTRYVHLFPPQSISPGARERPAHGITSIIGSTAQQLNTRGVTGRIRSVLQVHNVEPMQLSPRLELEFY